MAIYDGGHMVVETKHYNEAWTEECQGVATDGTWWYFASNAHRVLLDHPIPTYGRGIHRMALDLRRSARSFYEMAWTGSDHVGALGVSGADLVCALEKPVRLAIVRKDLSSGRLVQPPAGFPAEMAESFPFVAPDPATGLLWSGPFGADGDVRHLYAFDRHLVVQRKLTLDVASRRIQGGCITPGRHLVLASDHTHDLRVYDLATGVFQGSMPIAIDTGDGEEVEGVAYRDLTIPPGTYGDTTIPPGVRAQLHVVMLDNDDNGDDVYLKHYRVDHPDKL